MRSPRVWVVFHRVEDSKNQVLVGKRGPKCKNPGQWGFIGGNVDPGEDANKAASREVYEELGVHVSVNDFTEIRVKTVISPKGKSKFVTWLRAKLPTNEVPSTSEEVVEIKWLDLDDLDKLTGDLHYSVKELFEL